MIRNITKNLILIVACIALIGVNVSVAFANDDNKVNLCHCERAGQGDVFQCQTLEINQNAVDSHLQIHQADYLGQCPIPTTTPEPTETPRPTHTVCPTHTPTPTPTPTDTPCPTHSPSPTPPPFLICEDINYDGNPHYATGWHQIAGGPLLWGEDDVYALGSGYYTQCYCSPEGRGIQTNWTPGQGPEWGPDWGLNHIFYSYNNREYNCGGPTPTPTVTPSPEPTGAPQPCNGCGGWPSFPSCGAAKPSTPRLLSVVRYSTSAVLTWTASTPVTHYAIEYGVKEGEYIYGAANVGNVTSFTVGSLDPGTKYYFSVRAINDCMPSDPSTGGQVLGAAIGGIGGGDVKGLAFTGNSSLIYYLVSAGCAFFILSLASFRFNGRVS